MKKNHPIWRCLGLLVQDTLNSGMMVTLLLVPLLMGGALKYGLPLLYQRFPITLAIKPYGLFMDALLLLVTPYMTLFASSMLSLEERDNGICVALLTTPLGGAGYFISRFLLPAFFSAVYTIGVGLVFSTVSRPPWHTALLSVPASAVALSAILFIPAKARDKISGMAMGKLCGLLLFTVVIPFFLPWKWQPALSLLPSYWFYRFLTTPDWLMAVLCLVLSSAWCAPLYRGFRRRVLMR